MSVKMINDIVDLESSDLFSEPSRKVKQFWIAKQRRSTKETMTTETPENRTFSENKSGNAKHMTLLKKLFKYLNFTGALFGVRLNYKWNMFKTLFFWHIIAQLIFAWAVIGNHLYQQYVNGDMVRFLEPIGVVGQCNQNTYMLRYWHRILALIMDFTKISRQIFGGKREDIICDGLLATIKKLKIYVAAIWFCVGFYLVVPLKSFFVDHILITLMPFDVIFCDTSTMSGYWAANFIQAELGILSACGTCFYGSVLILLFLFYTIRVKLIRADFQELDKMWEEKIVSLAYKQAFLLNIVRKRQDLIRFVEMICKKTDTDSAIFSYLKNVKRIYEFQLSIYFFINYLSLIICLFQIIERDWVGGYAVLLLLFVQMAFYCTMSTQLVVANEEYRHMIWETNWYIYDKKSKYIVLTMLAESLSTHDIMLGPSIPLNSVTGISIMKSIYSYYTIMSEMF